MPPEVFPTTAENVISATDTVLAYPNGCDETTAARFMDVPLDSARYALQMAEQLGLVEQDSKSLYRTKSPLAAYLVTAKSSQKAAVLRLLLESYEPYRVFKTRLTVTGSAPIAAEQVRTRCGLTHHRDEVKDTLISLGTYSQSLISRGAGFFDVVSSEVQDADFLCTTANLASDRAIAENQVRAHLGEATCNWINRDEVLEPLVTAHQLLNPTLDCRAPVTYAGNAVESFLTQVGGHHGVSLAKANGINAKVDMLGTHIRKKHSNMLKYLGHVRNAADHGTDPEIGCSWDISHESALQYVHVAISTIKSVTLALLQSKYTI